MNSEEARLILNSARPGGKDDSDPAVAEALVLARRDGEFNAWLEETRAFDARLGALVRGTQPPAWLLDHILAGASIEGGPRRHRALWIAGAIAAAVIFAGVFAWKFAAPREAGFEQMRSYAANYIGEEWDHSFTLDESDFKKISTWLDRHPSLSHMDVSRQLAESATYGCKVIDWRRHKLSLVCFNVDGLSAEVHVIATPKKGLKNPPGPQPVYAKAGGFNSASWTRGDTVYVALTQASQGELASLL